MLEDLKHLLTEREFLTLSHKIHFVVEGDDMVAEDDHGAIYSYSEEGFPERRPNPSATEWLAISPSY